MIGKNIKAAPFLALFALAFAGCATTIRFEAQRVPTLDTSEIQRVAVRPFAPANNTSVAVSAANTLTSEVNRRLQGTGAFTLVSHTAVDAARARGADIDAYVDAEFTGRITFQTSNTTSRQEQRRDRAGNVTTHTIHTRVVELAFEYYFVRARDGVIIGPIQRRGSQSSSSEDVNALASEAALANRVIANQLGQFYRDVAPYSIRISRSLERERDRALRPHMDAARDLVRAGNYRGARDAYVAVWNMHGSVAAAINASVLYEALGETENAIFFMEHVHAATGAPRANQVLARLNMELQQQLAFLGFDAAQPQAERVAAHTIGEVRRVLPAHARVSIHNDATANQGLVNDVIDNMISAFLRDGIPVVERQLIELILAEQGLHMDGSVSDRDFISIGNLAGANTIVIVGITGAGAARRLQVRVLDIATGTVTMQSGTGSEWRL